MHDNASDQYALETAMRLKAATKDRKVEMITFADFKDQDVTHYGLKGSATSVERILSKNR